MTLHKLQKEGSILVFTMLVLSVLVVASLSLASAVLVGQRNAAVTDYSMQALQTADGGIEKMISDMRDTSNSNGRIENMGDECILGKVTGTIRNESLFTAEFFADKDDPDAEPMDCNDNVVDIEKIKVTGEYLGTARVLEVALAAGGGGCLEKSDFDKVMNNWICYEDIDDSNVDSSSTILASIAYDGGTPISASHEVFVQDRSNEKFTLCIDKDLPLDDIEVCYVVN